MTEIEILGRIEKKLDALVHKLALPNDARKAKCRKCDQEIYWADSLTRTKRDGSTYNYPVDPDGTPHWDTCPMEEKREASPAQSNQEDIPF